MKDNIIRKYSRRFIQLPLEVQLLAIWSVVAAIGAVAVLLVVIIMDRYV
jgi:hypothetical protein